MTAQLHRDVGPPATDPRPPAAIVIGTAGWSIPRASASEFPEAGSGLSRYAACLGGVEINSTFYRSHRASTYARWRGSVPKTFRFAAKIPKVISHDKALIGVESELDRFVSEISELGASLGPLLLQLPPRQAFVAATAATFFDLLRRFYRGVLVIEPRHPSWFTSDADKLLVASDVARVGADPAPVEGGLRPGGSRGTTYLRLHGSPRKYFSAYDEARLTEIQRLLASAAGVRWCIFDNTASGAAMANALWMSRQLVETET